jgi:hypothetical protein
MMEAEMSESPDFVRAFATIPVPVDRAPHDRRIAALEAKCRSLELRMIELGDRLERALAEMVDRV